MCAAAARGFVRAFLLLSCLLPCAARAAQDRSFTTSDGVRLHYLEAGRGRTLVLVPGWTMPAWIFNTQIEAFSRAYHVVAFDPRGQGESEAAPDGYEPMRRGRDIAELIAQLGPQPVVLLGWSLGVLDSLAYLHASGDAQISGLVLIDNSIGENPPPAPSHPQARTPRLPPELARRRFVQAMFRHPQDPALIDRLTEDSLRTPPDAAAALLAYPEPRGFWRDAVYSTRKPILYAVTPRLEGQARNLAQNDPAAEIALFPDAGHALFIDDADRFDAVLAGFLHRVWP